MFRGEFNAFLERKLRRQGYYICIICMYVLYAQYSLDHLAKLSKHSFISKSEKLTLHLVLPGNRGVYMKISGLSNRSFKS